MCGFDLATGISTTFSRYQMIPYLLTIEYRGVILSMRDSCETRKIESEADVSTFLDRLKYAIECGNPTIDFQEVRQSDNKRDIKFTNMYTMLTLFPGEDIQEVLKRELPILTTHDYIETAKDILFPKRSDMRVFGKKYSGEDVYIKIRVELLNPSGNTDLIYVLSFHFAEHAFADADFPYGK